MDYKSVLLECEARSEMYRCSNAVWNRTHEENCIAAITDLIARVEAAEKRAEKAERDRDAAINDLERIKSCQVCKHCDSFKNPAPIVCQKCQYGNLWEWRGAREE